MKANTLRTLYIQSMCKRLGSITWSMTRKLQQDFEEISQEGQVLFAHFEWEPEAQPDDLTRHTNPWRRVEENPNVPKIKHGLLSAHLGALSASRSGFPLLSTYILCSF